MREIKFRGKAKMTKEELDESGVPHINGWVFGNYSDGHILGEVIESNSEYIAHEWWCAVDPATVGQFIGKKDKSGQEIYEKDIVTANWYDYDEPAFCITGEVTYSEGWASFTIWDEENKKMSEINGNGHYHWEIEVIGNIHDNPELVE